MSLLREIQDASTGSDVRIADLLRKCKILATRLQHEQFKQWVDYELNGYSDKTSLPDYRVLKVQSFGDFSGAFGSGLRNAPIPPMCIPEKFRDIVDTWHCAESVSSLEDLVRNNSKTNQLRSNWPADLIAYTGQDIFERMVCLSAWRQVPRGAIVGVLDTIRTRILSFVLGLESEVPNAGEDTQIIKSDTNERITHIFNTYIVGNVGNFSAGSEQISQRVSININKGDFDSLKHALLKYGLSVTDFSDLEQALASDTETSQGKKMGLGIKTSEWLGKMVSKAAQGIWDISTSAASTILTAALQKYLGI